MKKLFVIGFAMLLGMSAMAQMNDGPHDMGALAGAPNTQICIYCHTPHNAITDVPLWNRNNPATGSYTMYDSSTLESSAAAAPGGISLLCMSCHDDTIALDAYGTHAATMGTISAEISGTTADLGQDLTNDHPISFTYDGTLATNDGELVTPAGGTVGTNSLQLFGTSSDQMECATCHDPHDNTNGNFLVIANTNSALCLNCHQK